MLSRFISSLPEPFKAAFRNTVLHDAVSNYYEQRRLFKQKFYEMTTSPSELQEQTFQTTVGPVSIPLPAYATKWEAYSGGKHEPLLTSAINQELDKTQVIYDVGCQFGYFVEIAKKSAALDKNIHAFEAKNFYYDILDWKYRDDETNIVHGRVAETVGSKSTTIDAYSETSETTPDVIKIDVEGAEMNVLRGAEETLVSETPRLYMEVHPNLLTRFDHTPDDIYRFLTELGFTVVMADHRTSDSDWKPISDSLPSDSDEYLIRATRE